MSVVMKSFEKLVLAHLKDIIGPSLDPLQFLFKLCLLLLTILILRSEFYDTAATLHESTIISVATEYTNASLGVYYQLHCT